MRLKAPTFTGPRLAATLGFSPGHISSEIAAGRLKARLAPGPGRGGMRYEITERQALTWLRKHAHLPSHELPDDYLRDDIVRLGDLFDDPRLGFAPTRAQTNRLASYVADGHNRIRAFNLGGGWRIRKQDVPWHAVRLLFANDVAMAERRRGTVNVEREELEALKKDLVERIDRVLES